MSRWLYKTKFVPPVLVVETLNACGEDGWELVSASLHPNGSYDLIFKKPAPVEFSPVYYSIPIDKKGGS